MHPHRGRRSTLSVRAKQALPGIQRPRNPPREGPPRGGPGWGGSGQTHSPAARPTLLELSRHNSVDSEPGPAKYPETVVAANKGIHLL